MKTLFEKMRDNRAKLKKAARHGLAVLNTDLIKSGDDWLRGDRWTAEEMNQIGEARSQAFYQRLNRPIQSTYQHHETQDR